MEILVIRHAQAVDHSADIDDGLRPLTAKGRRDALWLGRAMRHLGVELDAIVTSPLVRAVQTAEQVAAGLRFEGALDVAVELAGGRSLQAVVTEVLMPRADLARVAIVGHQPQLGQLVGMLLHDVEADLAKPSVVRLKWEGPDAPAKVKWVLRPGLDEPSKDLSDAAKG